MLISEFLFSLTDGDIVVWPPDLEVSLTSGAWAYIGSGGVSLVLGLVLLGCELDGVFTLGRRAGDHNKMSLQAVPAATVVPMPSLGIRPTGIQPQSVGSLPCVTLTEQEEPEGSKAQQSVSAEAATHYHEQQLAFIAESLASTRAQVRAHNHKVVTAVLCLMLLFVLFLGVAGFLLGRRAIENALQNALRGPQLTVKQTTGAIRDVPRSAGESLRGIHESLRNATDARLAAAARSGREACGTAAGDARIAALGALAAARSATESAVLAIRA
eukprot:CAMPEP_0168454398 /NCGR_PEP_ID=MMETSP0228-20121227/50200_1 /TAXON_ID=133427 /ORGANISM="Protoceratium reticulatum, Strain CCCM 535 (=CCMP 1889)" /LENGTH=270 /DNA_ID=CAMNT_0008469183 /DNA_START=191 /DNA_END=1000 /DNA_ORIENTATION=-